ncbi:MAG: 6-phosphofructokinase [Clostridia bacterium]|nr:6-phosphofructokinase [Clostridia bacterium]
MRKIGILTGGGDCPGLNAVIRGVVTRCLKEGIEVFGFHAGWRGVIECEGHWMTAKEVESIQTQGGTILGSSRTNVMKIENGPEIVRTTMEALGLEGLVAIGGDDTLGVANELRKLGMNMIGVPKTIDNDLSCTDWTFGFDTASNIATEEIDRLHTTAASHARCFVVECMGRHTGWIALQAGIAADAHLVLVPEFPMSFKEIYELVRNRYVRGERYTIIAVAEGFEFKDEAMEELETDMFGNALLLHRELARGLAERIEKAIRTDETLDKRREHFEARSVVLGHLQRGGAPSAFDRVLGTRMGVKAGELVVNNEYGNMVSLRGTNIAVADLERAVTERKKVDKEFYDVAALFF